LLVRVDLHDYEKRWRLYSSGAIAFATQIAWTIHSVGSFWSLYDVATDLVSLLNAASRFWQELKYKGRVRLNAVLNVPDLVLYQKQGLAPLYYEFVSPITGPLPLDATALTPTPQVESRPQSTANGELDCPPPPDEVLKAATSLLNQLIRGLGQGVNLEKLRRTIAHI
jgi:hypothetical protein